MKNIEEDEVEERSKTINKVLCSVAFLSFFCIVCFLYLVVVVFQYALALFLSVIINCALRTN